MMKAIRFTIAIMILSLAAKAQKNAAIDVNFSKLFDTAAGPINHCYQNNGLKYTIRLSINILSNYSVYGFAERTDDGSDKIQSFFTGKLTGNKIVVRWKKLPFEPGAASSWTGFGWIIKEGILKIPFKSKNYDTGKWAVTYAEFNEGCN